MLFLFVIFSWKPLSLRGLIFCTLALIYCSSAHLQAQSRQIVLDTNLFNTPEIWFDSLVGRSNSSLINGPEYIVDYIGRTSHPFFISKNWQKGDIFYQGNLYREVPLLYDIYQDILLLKHLDKDLLPVFLRVQTDRVDYFKVHDHLFMWFALPDSSGMDLNPGFYDLIYEGQSHLLLARRIKRDFIERSRREFEEAHKFYLISQGHFIPVKTKKDFYELYPNQISDIKAYIKANKLKINPRHESDLINLTRFCDKALNLIPHK